MGRICMFKNLEGRDYLEGLGQNQSQVKVTLQLTVGQSVSHDQIFIIVWQLRSCFCGVPSLTRGRVCLLYMLLALANAGFLGSESLGSRDHILLSHFWDFPFRRLLWLIGSRWRYSTPPPHGLGGLGIILSQFMCDCRWGMDWWMNYWPLVCSWLRTTSTYNTIADFRTLQITKC
jgi:hypothetical protein